MTEQKQLVSVVIPLYNAEKYIEETMQSILNQTYQNIEIIVVDDGSKDQSPTIVKELQRKHPEKVRYIHQKNQGVSVARNTGIEHANGEYVAFLDSDDLWHPSKIEKQVQSMHLNNMDACYCGYMNFYEETGEKVEHVTNFIKGDMTKAFLTHQVVAQTSTWIFKRSIVMNHDIRFTPGCSWGEDLEFLFKLMSVTNVCYVAEYLTYYRILSEGNLSSKYKDYELKTKKELEVFHRMNDWIHHKSSDLITRDSEELIQMIETYLFPYTVINNACIYIKENAKLEKSQVQLIKQDIKKYCRKIYSKNGKRSKKLYAMLWFVRMKFLFS
ncbi:glycosyltransferase family 2 protein [Bacillus cytotoxicus]|uniref:Glycosyl transferase family 2 n=1 Tax=Bacillus cytotoxicus TaxID=580165 RepID=A0AAX2CNC9_9BACI|nr:MULTISPECIES: glycosyltransferase family A protein [Bacillus cereus group]AWC30696.1 glycosyltransferase family 2 protein [Bacillus cytotoxicus]AWC42837.1 glycosyltransferase family 2 protein [Bacillus cytotoxicus]AWC50768.1 glycosyltransferase family 2 protein [Bacillus cytotoxicus]AWC54823.1 glycosyltransferase family 2 protein [Bacillus cytotoxicus]AWC58945.1 glycosyltransferase family 2 protein [Bacillus cytotoxicus]